MAKGVLYFEGIGNKNPLVDKDIVIWYLEQKEKTIHRNHRTRFWLNMEERYSESLLRMEAFEVLRFIKWKTSAEQKKHRGKWKREQAEKSQKELNYWREYSDGRNLINDLISKVRLN